MGARERGYMGLLPASARTGAGCMGLGAGCPGLQLVAGCPGHGPDVRAGSAWICSGTGILTPDFRGWGAGYPAGPVAPDVRGSAGCPGPVASSAAGPWRLCGLQGPDVRAKGRMSGAWEQPLFFFLLRDSVFFRLRFQASLVDGVVARRCRHSSSSSVKLRQYLCMHTRGVSSSIPSSRWSSEHV